jgi:hypothetical protein
VYAVAENNCSLRAARFEDEVGVGRTRLINSDSNRELFAKHRNFRSLMEATSQLV